MIISSVKNYKSVTKYFPQLNVIFNFINSFMTKNIKEGKYELDFGIYAIVQNSQPKPRCEQLLETHKKYVDLQYVISGRDKIGWKFLDKSFVVDTKYNKKNDITFFQNKPDFFIVLKKGDFAMFFSEDAHSPLCGKTLVKKCVFKIPQKFI
ncbi:MAG: YhcH/YjgK/YiaL family protein [Endomicrobiaceae bacterium]|nr:YhcH/YjgK/YiaL family protein [Endomicrobiaceae bacterium]